MAEVTKAKISLHCVVVYINLVCLSHVMYKACCSRRIISRERGSYTYPARLVQLLNVDSPFKLLRHHRSTTGYHFQQRISTLARSSTLFRGAPPKSINWNSIHGTNGYQCIGGTRHGTHARTHARTHAHSRGGWVEILVARKCSHKSPVYSIQRRRWVCNEELVLIYDINIARTRDYSEYHRQVS